MGYNEPSGIVAQLVRALPCHGRGREFESRRIRHIWKVARVGLFFVRYASAFYEEFCKGVLYKRIALSLRRFFWLLGSSELSMDADGA